MKENCIRLVFIMTACTFWLSGCSLTKQGENINAGMEAIAALDYDAALVSFEQARETGENNRQMYRGEGLAYMGKTMYAEAAASFESALSNSNGRVDSMDYDINYYLATAYYKLGQLDRAIKVYDAIIALRPSEKDAYYLRGVLYTEKDNLEAALADFDKAIALDIKDYDRLIDIYCVLDDNGYRESGQTYLQEAMENGTRNMTNYEKGRISYYLDDYENARNYLEKARDTGDYEAILFLGKTHETLGDSNYAISVYNTYLDSEGPNPHVLNQMGLCKLQMKDYSGALEAFQTAMSIEDNSIMQTLKMNEIVAYEMLGEYKKAAVLLEAYLKKYPDDLSLIHI